MLIIIIYFNFLINQVNGKTEFDYDDDNTDDNNNNEKKSDKIDKNIYQFLHLPIWTSKAQIESAFKEKLRIYKRNKVNDLEIKNLYRAYINYEKEYLIKGQQTFFSTITKTIKDIFFNVSLLYLFYYAFWLLTKINNIRVVSFSFILAFLIIDKTIPNYFPNFHFQLIASILFGLIINKCRNILCPTKEKKKDANKDLKEKAKKLENEINELNKQNKPNYKNEQEEREMLEKRIAELEKTKRELKNREKFEKNNYNKEIQNNNKFNDINNGKNNDNNIYNKEYENENNIEKNNEKINHNININFNINNDFKYENKNNNFDNSFDKDKNNINNYYYKDVNNYNK